MRGGVYTGNTTKSIETTIMSVSDLRNAVNGETPGIYRDITLSLTHHELRNGEKISPDQRDCFPKATISYRNEDLTNDLGTNNPNELKGRKVEASYAEDRVLSLRLKL